jgi:hypothetical protein
VVFSFIQVLAAWKSLSNVFQGKRMKIVRTELDDKNRIVGLLVPPGLVDAMMQNFKDDKTKTALPATASTTASTTGAAAAAAAAPAKTTSGATVTAFGATAAPTASVLAPSAAFAQAGAPTGVADSRPTFGLSSTALPAEHFALQHTGAVAVAQGVSEGTLLGSGLWEKVPLTAAYVRFDIVNAEPDDSALMNMGGSDGEEDSDFGDSDDDDFFKYPPPMCSILLFSELLTAFSPGRSYKSKRKSAGTDKTRSQSKGGSQPNLRSLISSSSTGRSSSSSNSQPPLLVSLSMGRLVAGKAAPAASAKPSLVHANGRQVSCEIY